jgi:hypothetical protein
MDNGVVFTPLAPSGNSRSSTRNRQDARVNSTVVHINIERRVFNETGITGYRFKDAV